jgi:NarL family two-component system sensor histidine kinase YdfH
MQIKSSPDTARGERDPRLLMWTFVTFAVASVYVITLINQPSIRQPLSLIIFTGLTLVHIVLHWQLGRIINQPRKITWYILLQGVLAFFILLLANNLLMTTTLFMVLIGEAIGVLGLTRRSLLAAIYFGLLLTANLVILFGWDSAGSILLGTLPIAAVVILFVILYMRQIEARQQAQSLTSELEAANRQLAEYAAQVEELTLAAERQRIARELHDTLSQGLTGLVLQLEAIKAHLEAGREGRALAIIDQSLARARSTLADSRAAIDDLRAMPASLTQALQSKTERFTQATGIPCKLSIHLGDVSPPENIREHLLRVLSEALANITRHARASQVRVRLEAFEESLEMEIQDDGQGFDPAKTPDMGHYGLLGMRERARLAGGNLVIDSEVEQGTRIRLIVPLRVEN